MDSRQVIDDLFSSVTVRIAVIGVLAILALFLFAKTMLAVQDFGSINLGNTATITVTGTGKATTVPNLAHISFAVEENASSVANAQDAATKKTDSALGALKKLGIAEKDIQASGYSISPEYATPSCPPGVYCPASTGKIIGYQVTQSVEVKVRDTTKTGDVLQALGTAGVQNVSGPNFVVDDTTLVQTEARGKAIADARAQAEILSRQLGVHLGKVVGFSENGGGAYPVYASGMAKAATMDSVAPAPTLPVGENETTTSVTVIYEIR